MDTQKTWKRYKLAVFITACWVLVILLLLQTGCAYQVDQADQDAELELLIRRAVREEIREELQELKQDDSRELDLELKERLQEWLDTWEVETKEVTFYAPLDPGAVEGVCYAGDPNVTASGAQVEIGETVAAGPDVPFGTRVYIQELGFRRVTDRGGAIGNRSLDVAVWSRSDAFRRGIEQRIVVVEKPGND